MRRKIILIDTIPIKAIVVIQNINTISRLLVPFLNSTINISPKLVNYQS